MFFRAGAAHTLKCEGVCHKSPHRSSRAGSAFSYLFLPRRKVRATSFASTAVCTLAPHSPKFLIKYAKKHSENRALFVSMGYEKDIFGTFSYEFELSQFFSWNIYR